MMAYAQTNYPEPQGIPPTKYTIAQVGCFITAFCNLEQRFGKIIDPSGMNAFLRDNNFYIDVDDGVRDDVSWDTITKYDPNTTVTQIGNGAPPSSNAIVKFVYNGGSSTHFCLVNDASAGTIIDSWDAKIKSWNVYGGPVAYAVYNNKGVNMDSFNEGDRVNLNKWLYGNDLGLHGDQVGKTYKDAISGALTSPEYINQHTVNDGDAQNLANAGISNADSAKGFIWKDAVYNVVLKNLPTGGTIASGTYLRIDKTDIVEI